MARKISHITFVTSNNKKFEWIKDFLFQVNSNITLSQVALDLPEYQSLDVNVVSRAKAQEAWKHIQAPLIIDDGGIYLEAYNQFPGPLTRYVFEGIGFDGFFKLTQDNPRAHFLTHIVFTADGHQYYTFDGTLRGTITQPKKPIDYTSRMPFTQIFIPENYTQTLDILIQKQTAQELNHRFKAIKKFADFLKNNENR